MFELYKNYMELFFVVLMIIGALIALSAKSAVISYIMVLLAGIFGGRLIYERKHKIQFPYYIILAGFLIGYLIAVPYGDRWVVTLLFVIGAVLSYKTFNKRVIKDTRF